MTRQEAIEKLSTIGHISVSYAEGLYDSFFPKPVVPQCVANWYEGHKDEFEINLYREVCRSEENYEYGSLTDFQKWLISGKTNSFSVLVNMHQFGYEVKKETKYMVRFKNIGKIYSYLNYDTEEQSFKLSSKTESMFFKPKFTKEFLKKNSFGWVFDCEGVEVEEVE